MKGSLIRGASNLDNPVQKTVSRGIAKPHAQREDEGYKNPGLTYPFFYRDYFLEFFQSLKEECGEIILSQRSGHSDRPINGHDGDVPVGKAGKFFPASCFSGLRGYASFISSADDISL